MRSDKLGSQLGRKSKTCFFTILNVYVSLIERDKILISLISHLRNLGILKTTIDLRGDPIEMNFDIFQMRNWIPQTVRAQKADEKRGHLSNVIFSFCVMVLKLARIVHFLQLCADLSKKCKSIKAIYLYPSKRPHHPLSENLIQGSKSHTRF